MGYASTCNSVGQTAGYFLGYVIFVALESADFCNKYLRSVPESKGLLTFSGMTIFHSALSVTDLHLFCVSACARIFILLGHCFYHHDHVGVAAEEGETLVVAAPAGRRRWRRLRPGFEHFRHVQTAFKDFQIADHTVDCCLPVDVQGTTPIFTSFSFKSILYLLNFLIFLDLFVFRSDFQLQTLSRVSNWWKWACLKRNWLCWPSH